LPHLAEIIQSGLEISSGDSKVYEKKPRTTEDLKQNISEEVAAIPPTMLQRVMQSFQKRLRECVDNNGRHLTDAIFRK
jgi:hypothetical protein